MPEIFINGQPVQAEAGQTVMQAALANGFYIPYFCWHPELSIAGNCRICTVQVEGRSWVEISCNMPVTEGLHVLTDSDLVREHRKATMQFITLNHPVDCGICDKAGECTLQDYHFAYNGSPSVSREPKVRATQVPRPVRADPARQRALHPLFALRALHARDLKVERARHQEPRRRVAGARRRRFAARRRSLLR
jgi:NADH dehydrogenase/NADH:ubiquinone oxidoreductase subunit G